MKNSNLKKLLLATVLIVNTTSIIVLIATKKPDNPLRPLALPNDTSLIKYYETQIDHFDSELEWDYQTNTSYIKGQPNISAKSALAINMQTGEILFEKNSTEVLPIASLSKIMTAVIVLEHSELDKVLRVSKRCAAVGENTMNLSENEVYKVHDLLIGLILESGNDAACVLAEGTADSTEQFVDWMNIKAKKLGLTNTLFYDPSGLDNRTFSTSQDMLRLTRYALKNTNFRAISKTLKYEIPATDTNKALYLNNQTNLLSTYPGVEGVKTGYTAPAGLCLVTYANNEGKEVLAILLNSNDRKGEMILILDHVHRLLGIPVEHNLL